MRRRGSELLLCARLGCSPVRALFPVARIRVPVPKHGRCRQGGGRGGDQNRRDGQADGSAIRKRPVLSVDGSSSEASGAKLQVVSTADRLLCNRTGTTAMGGRMGQQISTLPGHRNRHNAPGFEPTAIQRQPIILLHATNDDTSTTPDARRTAARGAGYSPFHAQKASLVGPDSANDREVRHHQHQQQFRSTRPGQTTDVRLYDATHATDPMLFIKTYTKQNPWRTDEIQLALKSYADGSGKTALAAFANVGKECRKAGFPDGSTWIDAARFATAQLINRGKHNAAQTTLTATNTMMGLLFDTPIDGITTTKLRKTAYDKQQQNLVDTGQKVTEGMNMRKFWIMVRRLEQDKQRAGMPFVKLRTILYIMLRTIAVSRNKEAADQLQVHEMALRANGLDVRYIGSKDTLASGRNPHERPGHKKERANTSSLVEITFPEAFPFAPLPDMPEWYREYAKQSAQHPSPILQTVIVNGNPEITWQFFHGAPPQGRHEYAFNVGTSTLASAATKMLKECGAIPPGSPLTSKHLRHTGLSQLFFSQPDRIYEGIMTARHTMETFTGSYLLELPLEQKRVLEMMRTAPDAASKPLSTFLCG